MGERHERRLLRSVADSLTRIGIHPDATILIALSGGADSVALFHAMLSLHARFACRIAAAHLNHGIRGAESDRDEAFVRALCARRRVELIVDHAGDLSLDTPNLEERARDARHAFLNATADRIGADYIALAHQADDQAETVMMRLLRGAGAAGLAAMAQRGPGRIIRPVLNVTHDEVTAYLRSIGESFVNDSSNQSAAILRNRVRAELMPILERNYAPGLRGRMVQLAAEMRALDDFIGSAARHELEVSASGDSLDLSRFAGLHPALQAELIRQYIRNFSGSLRRIERAHIDAVRNLCLDGPPNSSLDLPGLRIVREYAMLTVAAAGQSSSASSAQFMVKLEEGAIEIPEAGFMFQLTTVARKAAPEPSSKFEARFDAAQAVGKLTVRNFRAGDRIAPFGMNGHRKVKDIFIDHKLSAVARRTFPIVLMGETIAWLPGIVRGQVGLVTEGTENVLHLSAGSAMVGHH